MPAGWFPPRWQDDEAFHRQGYTLFGEKVIAPLRDVVSTDFSGLGTITSKVFRILNVTTVNVPTTEGEVLFDQTNFGGRIVFEDTQSSGTTHRVREVTNAITSGGSYAGQITVGVSTTITLNPALHGDLVVVNGVATARCGTSATSNVAMESREVSICPPGGALLARFTAGFLTASWSATTSGYVGVFSLKGSSGVGVGYSGTTFGAVWRRAGAATFVPQASWNIDALGGSGPSRQTLTSPDFLQLWGIHLDTSRLAVLYWCDPSGRWWPVHRFVENTGTRLLCEDSHYGMRAEIAKTSGSNTPEVQVGSWKLSRSGTGELPMMFSATGVRAGSTLTGGFAILGALMNPVLLPDGRRNNARIKVHSIGHFPSVLAETAIRVFKNGARNVPSSNFQLVDAANSVARFEFGATIQSVSGVRLLAFESAHQLQTRYGEFSRGGIILAPGELISLHGFISSAGNITFSLQWEEY